MMAPMTAPQGLPKVGDFGALDGSADGSNKGIVEGALDDPYDCTN